MLMIQRLAAGWSVGAIAATLGLTAKTVTEWRDRHAAEGAPGQIDRSSRPHRSLARLARHVEEETRRCAVSA